MPVYPGALASLQYPSLRAKKYDESADLWQARVNKDWRFYFTIADDTYRSEDNRFSRSVNDSSTIMPGILTELARFEAERILVHLVREEIATGRL